MDEAFADQCIEVYDGGFFRSYDTIWVQRCEEYQDATCFIAVQNGEFWCFGARGWKDSEWHFLGDSERSGQDWCELLGSTTSGFCFDVQAGPISDTCFYRDSFGEEFTYDATCGDGVQGCVAACPEVS